MFCWNVAETALEKKSFEYLYFCENTATSINLDPWREGNFGILVFPTRIGAQQRSHGYWYEFLRATLTTCHRPGGSDNRREFSSSLDDWFLLRSLKDSLSQASPQTPGSLLVIFGIPWLLLLYSDLYLSLNTAFSLCACLCPHFSFL